MSALILVVLNDKKTTSVKDLQLASTTFITIDSNKFIYLTKGVSKYTLS
jgi:hypothetical protein